MPPPIAGLFSNFFFKPVLRPILRLLGGLVAIPIFRLLLKKVFKVQANDVELERDLEQWFRGAVIMIAATANLEDFLFGWLPWHSQAEDTVWQTLLLRLLLAIGVIESMPDEDVFAILHRGPPRLKLTTRAGWREAWRLKKEVLRGLGILHLRRSSPVFAIMAVIFGGPPDTLRHTVGWWCYALAITQYLIIAIITQRDRIAGLLETFDRKASVIREEILHGTAVAPVVIDSDDASNSGLHPGRHD